MSGTQLWMPLGKKTKTWPFPTLVEPQATLLWWHNGQWVSCLPLDTPREIVPQGGPDRSCLSLPVRRAQLGQCAVLTLEWSLSVTCSIILGSRALSCACEKKKKKKPGPLQLWGVNGGLDLPLRVTLMEVKGID